MSAVANNNNEEATVAEYALGVLPYAERLNFEKRMSSDIALQNRVAWWQQKFVPMAAEIAPIAPPASVLSNIEDRLFASSTAKSSGWWNNLGFWRGLSIASLAGVIVLGGLLANGTFQTSTPIQPADVFVAQLAGETSDLKLAALYDSGTNTLKLNRTAGQAATSSDFELWVIAGDNAPVSLGLLPDDTNSFEIVVPQVLQAALADNAILAVSDEPDGGSPTGQPTGAVLAVGQIIPI